MEEPKGMSWSAYTVWYKNNKKEGIAVRDAWKIYKKENGIETVEKKKTTTTKKKTSTEKRKKKGIRLTRTEDGEVTIDLVIKQRLLGDDRKSTIKKPLLETEWNNLRTFIRENITTYEIGSISIVVDRPEILSIRLLDMNEEGELKSIKKTIIKITKDGITSINNERLKYYLI